MADRMSATLTRLARTRGRLPALVTAALLAALLLAQSLLSSLVGWGGASVIHQLGTGTSLLGGPGPWFLSDVVEAFLIQTVPFALGVFVSLWAIAPLAAQLSVPFVITRALLAAAAGVVLATIVGVFVAFLRLVSSGFRLTGLAELVIMQLTQAINSFIFFSPFVVLAALLLWLWLREHPRDYEVSGLIDEV